MSGRDRRERPGGEFWHRSPGGEVAQDPLALPPITLGERDRLERLEHFPGTVETVVRILGERALQQEHQSGRHIVSRQVNVRYGRVEMVLHEPGECLGLEGERADEHLVREDAE